MSFQYTAKLLLRCRDFFAQHPEGEVRPDIWPEEYLNRENWYGWFRSCLEAKINREQKETRKTSDEYQMELRRLSRHIGNRVVVDWISPILGERVIRAMKDRFRNEATYERLLSAAKNYR